MQRRLKPRISQYTPRAITLLLCAALAFSPQAAWAWGIHNVLTKVAVDRLAPWQRELIKAEEAAMVRRYCIFPDIPREPDAQRYLIKFPAEAKVSFHIPASLEQNKMLLDAYLPKIAALLREGNIGEAMRYYGCVMHYLEDSSAPCHMVFGEAKVPDDGPPLLQMDFFKRFMPLPDKVDQEMLHSRIDSCGVTEEHLAKVVDDYAPRLLGRSVEELTFNLLEEHLRMNQQSSKQVVPMLTALAADDEAAFIECGAVAAAGGTRLSADVLHTLLCIARSRFDGAEPAEVSLADRTPARGAPFAWSDKNHQGRLLYNASGAVSSNMSEPAKLGRHPLKLKMADGAVREFAKGYGVGWKTEYTFLLPKGAFQKFTVYTGNDAALGGESINTFEVLLDDKPIAATPKLKGDAPAQRLEVPLGDAGTITLRCKSEGPASRTHGVWAEPMLVR